MTKQESYAEALLVLGERELESRSRKFRTFSATPGKTTAVVDGPPLLWFLGKSGALRLGRCASESHAVLDLTKTSLLRRAKLRRELDARRGSRMPQGDNAGEPVDMPAEEEKER